MNLKFFIAGLGSMGKRRIRNLLVNNQNQIVGYDIRPDRTREASEKYGIKTIENLDQMKSDDYNAMIISTTPNEHGDYIRMALHDKKHFFVEHPISDDGYREVFDDTSNIIKAPSCTFLFYTPLKMIKEIINSGRIGKVLAFQYHMGQYLPDWHPWEDYKDVYFSKKETGACREMLPFELIWLSWVFGSKVTNIDGFIGKLSDLDMDADDTALAKVRFDNGIIGNVIIDVIARKPYRTLRVLGSEGTLDWERFDSEIKVYDTNSKTTETLSVPKGRPEPNYVNEEEMYNDEIETFLKAISGEVKYPHTFENSHHLLKKLYEFEANKRY
jgi:predicted dehydrogenase